jgi:hypothetical protein
MYLEIWARGYYAAGLLGDGEESFDRCTSQASKPRQNVGGARPQAHEGCESRVDLLPMTVKFVRYWYNIHASFGQTRCITWTRRVAEELDEKMGYRHGPVYSELGVLYVFSSAGLRKGMS